MNNIKLFCILCENNPEEGMYLSGEKLIKGHMISYQLCEECCSSSYENSGDGSLSRKNLWCKVESKLMQKYKKQKSRMKQ